MTLTLPVLDACARESCFWSREKTKRLDCAKCCAGIRCRRCRRKWCSPGREIAFFLVDRAAASRLPVELGDAGSGAGGVDLAPGAPSTPEGQA